MESTFTPEKLLTRWSELSSRDPLSETNKKYKMIIEGVNGGAWIVVTGDRPSIKKLGHATEARAECEVTLLENDLSGIVKRQLNPQILFLQGKMRIKGDVCSALNFNLFLEQLLECVC